MKGCSYEEGGKEASYKMFNKLCVFLSLAVGTFGRRPVKEYIIDLDAPPETRYNELLPEFNSTVWGFYTK